ncbi:hypothetical protein AAER89_29360, partial [Klebsiella pneumoniae]|uniref:hypothetical protein n=1 Tax=Klebsiella pneumoniae TaxID=573 RepID=UPI003136001E
YRVPLLPRGIFRRHPTTHADRVNNNDTVTSADFSGQEKETIDINQQMLTPTLINLIFPDISRLIKLSLRNIS